MPSSPEACTLLSPPGGLAGSSLAGVGLAASSGLGLAVVSFLGDGLASRRPWLGPVEVYRLSFELVPAPGRLRRLQVRCLPAPV